MRLKTLETYGFKSFADRMTFDFEDGITAVIGPNGCGKSNIVDSIKWVIGEQSAKALRGSEMSDIIFNGCATRRPMAMAEVTLTVEGLGVEKGLPGGEAAITRRLTRDGQSSYYINGKPSRLKDIRELLMDTGIGMSAYSVIEQGRIGFILEASVKDRRGLLEEAAGINRYKARRKVALRKLERVQMDLERIGQVLGEVTRRVRTVKRQAETALKFQELTKILKELRMVFALEEFGRLSGELTKLGERHDDVQARALELMTKLGELEAAIAEGETKQLELEDALRDRERERAEAQSKRDVAASRARDARHRLTELDQQETEDRKALEEHDERRVGIEQELNQTQASLEEKQEEGDSRLNDLYATRRQELDNLIAVIDEIIRGVDERKARQVECLRELARIDAEQARLESSRSAMSDRRARLQERASGHEEQMTGAVKAEEESKAAVESLKETVEKSHATLHDLIKEREESQTRGNQLDQQMNDLRHEEGRAEVRLRMLSEYERKAEGVHKGVRHVLQQMDRMPGICGLVADCFRVGKREETAIETALGGAAQNIITETQQSAKEAIDFLKRERRGRATFLPLDDIRGRERPDRRFQNMPGVVGVGSDLIEYEKKFAPAFDNLLGGLLVMETLEHAIAVRRSGARCLLVTLDGEVINPGGAMTGGRTQGREAGGLVSRKNEIARLEEELKELTDKRSTVAGERDAIKKQAFELSMKVEEQRRTIQKDERSLSEANQQQMKAERDRLHIEEFSMSFGNELQEIDGEIARLETDVHDLSGQKRWFQALADRLDRELETQQAQVGERAAERDRMQEEINTLRVDLATTEERREALRNHCSVLQRNLRELDDAKAERERRLAQHTQRREELTQQADENEKIRDEQNARFEEMAASLKDELKERDDLRHGVEEKRQEHRSLGSKHRNLERELQEVELKRGELKVRVEGLCDRIREDYEVELSEAFENWERPKDLDLPKVRRDLAQTEKELASLGPVNLAAIDELKEVEAKEAFLAQQHEDLATAAAKLSEIIDQINTTSRKLFTRTYKQVRKNFQELFRKLFGGGKADLVLQVDEGEDILEAGVDIIAQPPGKQPKSITLLSGGEKALTAIALLFGVYMIKPSPFCLLDEVDAPLDDSNTDVYCKMVQEFCDQSQFIVITHNKRTMQHADAIYGITQQERGISTKISVKLEEVDDEGNIETTAGRGPFAESN